MAIGAQVSNLPHNQTVNVAMLGAMAAEIITTPEPSVFFALLTALVMILVCERKIMAGAGTLEKRSASDEVNRKGLLQDAPLNISM